MQHYMTRFFVLLPFVTLAIGCQNQTANDQPEQQTVATTQVVQGMVVEAACGECLFELEGDGCDLAVRIDGKAYFVDDSEIDDHGDAHADHGFCNAVRQARVQGSIENGRFVATSFELLPSDDE